jgi:hypothetical protein
MLLVIDDALHASMNFTVTKAEKGKIADVWMRILSEIIPEERLQDCFDHAFAVHKSNFPVNAYDLKNAWEKICEAEAAEKLKAEIREREANPVLLCPNIKLHFEGEFNGEKIKKSDGLLLIALGFNEPELPMPCDKCRPAANAQFLERRKANSKTVEIVDQILYPPKAELDALDAEIERLGKEARNGNGKSHKEWLKLIEKRADF